MYPSTCGLVAMTSASHAEGRQFDPGQVYGLSSYASVTLSFSVYSHRRERNACFEAGLGVPRDSRILRAAAICRRRVLCRPSHSVRGQS